MIDLIGFLISAILFLFGYFLLYREYKFIGENARLFNSTKKSTVSILLLVLSSAGFLNLLYKLEEKGVFSASWINLWYVEYIIFPVIAFFIFVLSPMFSAYSESRIK